MILSAPATAAVLEAAEACHLRRQVQAYRALAPACDALAMEVAGGVAALTDPDFGRKLNHVTGVGLEQPLTDPMLQALEAAYAQRGLPCEIDLSTHAAAANLAVLARRGYVANAVSHTYAIDLASCGHGYTVGLKEPLNILAGHNVAAEAFIDASVAGFSAKADNRPRRLLQTLAHIATTRADTSLFLAKWDGEVAASAATCIVPTQVGPVAYLYIASTLAAFRGRGIQLAMLQARLAAARAAGCVMACVTARPGNVSARNTERAGLSLAYAKFTLARPAVR